MGMRYVCNTKLALSVACCRSRPIVENTLDMRCLFDLDSACSISVNARRCWRYFLVL